jgi:hypothetical protein
MMPFLHFLRVALLLELALGSLCAAESVVDFGSFAVVLPDGYTDHDQHGIDSRSGYITIKNKPFKIEYDSSAWDGSPKRLSRFFTEDMLDAMIYYERTEDDQVPNCLIVALRPNAPGKPIVTLWVLGLGWLDIHTSDKTEVSDALAALRAIKVTKARSSKP